MSEFTETEAEKVNNNIFGTPRLAEMPLSRSHTTTTVNTSAYETPLASLNGVEWDAGADDDDGSVLTGTEQNEVFTINSNGAHSASTLGRAISNPDNYYSEAELQRVHTGTDLYQLELQKTMSKFSKKSHEDEKGIFIGEMQWDGPDDKENPLNWSNTKKWFITMTTACICLVVTFGSSLYVSGAFEIMAKMQTSQEMVLTGLTLYLIGLALGPAVAAPLSELFGRKVVYCSSLPISMLFIMGVGLSENIGSILVLRFFSGFFASPAMAIAGGTIADIWTPDKVGLAMSTFCLAPFLGPVIGPVIGGFVAEEKGWKWCLWVNLMAAGLILPFVFLCDETNKNTIMRKRAKKRGITIKAQLSGLEYFKFIMTVTLLTPLKMLVVEPIVTVFSIYVAFVFAVLFGFFEAYPVIFRGTYGMGLGTSGLPFIGIGLGLAFGTLLFIGFDRYYFLKKNEDGTFGKRGKNGEPFKHTPESRLLICKIGAASFPVSLFWLGWTARPSVHWMAPVAAGVPFGFSLVLIFLGVMLYFTMSYPPLSVASALAANNLARYVLASVFPLFTVQMYDKLGNGWASSLFGFIALVMVPVPWIFEKWGPELRSRSQYGFDAIKKGMAKDEKVAESSASSEGLPNDKYDSETPVDV